MYIDTGSSVKEQNVDGMEMIRNNRITFCFSFLAEKSRLNTSTNNIEITQ